MARRWLPLLLVTIVLLLSACSEQPTDIMPSTIYCVTTTEGDGYILLDRTPDHQWQGNYYLSKGGLTAVQRKVRLETGRQLALADDEGRTIPILDYSPYRAPAFKDYPDTWGYRDSAYAVTEQHDVVYGRATGYWTSYPDTGDNFMDIFDAKWPQLQQGQQEQPLTMDLYLPDDGQTALRPLLVLIHGGGFFCGDKTDMGFPEWARHFAAKGYVVASVNYRLGFLPTPAAVQQAGHRAMQDVDAAIRYIIHQQRYAADPRRVFVAGASAGAITALNIAFMDDEDIPACAAADGGRHAVSAGLTEPYAVRAVGNMWGAVSDPLILDNAPTAVISFHSTGDPVVPYGKGHPFECFWLKVNRVLFPPMYGSRQISHRLGHRRSVLRSYNLPGRHTLHVDTDECGTKVLNSHFREIETAMRDFFSAHMLPAPIVARHADRSPSFFVSSPDADSVSWRAEGGVVLSQTGCRADILLFPDAPSHAVTVCGKYKSGLTFRHQWNF